MKVLPSDTGSLCYEKCKIGARLARSGKLNFKLHFKVVTLTSYFRQHHQLCIISNWRHHRPIR